MELSADRLAVGPHRLFVYGTLTFPEVLEVLLDRRPALLPTTVTGWQVRALAGRIYPGIVPMTGSRAEGFLLTDLTPAEWRVLDAFESPFYRLLPVDPEQPEWAHTYVAPVTETLDKPWSRSVFESTELAEYVLRCAGFRTEIDLGR